MVLFVVALHRLHRVGQRPGGDQDQHDQDQGIDVEAEIAGKAQGPDRTQQARKQRHPYPGKSPEVEPQHAQDDERGQSDDEQDGVFVAEHPGVQHGEAGDVHPVLAVGLQLGLEGLHPAEEVLEVNAFFPEAGRDQGRGVVLGHVEAVHALVGIHRLFDRLDIVGRLRRRRIHDGVGGNGGAADLNVAHLGVGQRQDLIRVDACGFQHIAGRLIDLVDRVDVENIALVGLNDDAQNVGRAKHPPVLLVQLDVLVGRRVEIKEVGLDLHLGHIKAQKQGGQRQDDQHIPAKFEEKIDVCFHPAAREHETLLGARNETDEPVRFLAGEPPAVIDALAVDVQDQAV